MRVAPARKFGNEMSDQIKFVILAGPRTGSTYLVDYLNAVPDTRCFSELFQTGRIDFRHHQPADSRLQDVTFRDRQPIAFLSLAAEEVKPCPRFGFKIVPDPQRQALFTFVQQICIDREWKKIYLWRDNLFEQAVSFLLAERQFGKGVWERTPDQTRITISPRELLAVLHLLQREYLAIEAALGAADGDDLFSLEYTDLGRPAVMGDLLRFLDVPQTLIDDRIAGTGRDRELDFNRGPALADRIENYREIRDFLLNSRYRRFIMQSA